MYIPVAACLSMTLLAGAVHAQSPQYSVEARAGTGSMPGWQQPASGEFYRPRCEKCGISPFGGGDLPELGGAFVSINVRCLDGVALAGVPIRYFDGLHDTWAIVGEGTFVDPFAGLRA